MGNERCLRLTCLFFSCLISAGSLAAAREEPPSLPQRVDALFAEWNRPDSPGCAVGVIREGRLVHAAGYGRANLDHEIPITPTTVFDIGSTSKQFTAVAILLLEQDGLLSIDDPARKYLAELPEYQRPLTIRHLLNHTSGIRDYLVLMELKGLESHDVYELNDVVEIVTRQQRLNFAPGEEYLYSNSGYILLAAIAERVSGKPMGQLLEGRVFGPLGMHHTQVYDDRTRVIPGRATGYSRNGDETVVDHYYNFAVPGDGQIYTTIEDLGRWDRVFQTHEVLGEELITRLQEQGVLNDGKQISYALGLQVGEHRGLKTVRHGGGWGGFRSDLMRFPEQQLSVVCLCNLGSISATRQAEKVAAVYLGDLLAVEDSSDEAPLEAVEPKIETLRALEGSFQNPETHNILLFEVREGKLTVTNLRSGSSYPLIAAADHRFRIDGIPVRVVIEFTDAGGAREVILHQSGTSNRFVAVTREVPTEEVLRDYAGIYHSEELEIDYRIVAGDDHLTVEFGRGAKRELRPATGDVFLGGWAIEFGRDDQGSVTGFNLSAGRVRDIVFVRDPGSPPATR